MRVTTVDGRDGRDRRDRWDPLAPAAVADPFAAMSELRAQECPIAWAPRGAGFWAVSRAADVDRIARDVTTFRNSGNPVTGVSRPPLEVDRPVHTLYRRLLAPYFSVRAIDRLEEGVRGDVRAMLAPLVAAGEGDAGPALTYPLPARTLCRLLRLPDADWLFLKERSEEIFANEEGRAGRPERIAAANAELEQFSRRLVAARAAEPLDPGDDLVTGLLAAAEHGVTPDDVAAVVRLLLTAGHNSTTSALGNVLFRLATDPDVQARLRREPEAIASAVEEFLRFEAPVLGMPRVVDADVELYGRTLRRGDQLFLLWGSANRDEAMWSEPDRCDIDRDASAHYSFGKGIHRCIGQGLARLELRVCVEEALAATTAIELAGDVRRTGWNRYGVSALPLRFTPAVPGTTN